MPRRRPLPGPKDLSEQTSKQSFDQAASFFKPRCWAIGFSCAFRRSKSTGLVRNSAASYSAAWRRRSSLPSGYPHDYLIGEPLLDLDHQLQSVHTGYVDVGEDRDQRGLDCSEENVPVTRQPLTAARLPRVVALVEHWLPLGPCLLAERRSAASPRWRRRWRPHVAEQQGASG
jgi:hypothetical protein